MTQEEKTYYENVRANPKDPVFDMLFTQNFDGSIHPKPGVVFKLMNGIPYIEDMVPVSSLLSFVSPNTLDSIRTDADTLKKITQEYALSSPFGKDSLFYTEPTCGDFTNDFYLGGINYELLAQDLRKRITEITPSLFNYEKYALPDKDIVAPSAFGRAPHITAHNNNPFEYKNKEGKTETASFEEGKLNTRKCYLGDNYIFAINTDLSYKVYYSLYFPYKDAKIGKGGAPNGIESLTEAIAGDEQYAIILKTTNANSFLEFIKKIRSPLFCEKMKGNIIAYYNYFFSQAKNDADKLDGLYENIPDFVLEQKNDLDLWNDLTILSESGINTWGTNENISILNLLKGVKNKNWWYQQINQNPETVRSLFDKFSTRYIEDLIISFSTIGYGVWTQVELDKAWMFNLDYEELHFEIYKQLQNPNNPLVRYTGFAYYQKEKRQYQIGTAIFAYTQNSMMPYNSREIGPKELYSPFAPLKTQIGKETIHIPAFVAEYFTDKKITAEIWDALHNIVDALLPELGFVKARSLFTFSKISQGKTIRTMEELIEFLDKIDQNVLATDLEKVGIQVLFRGTTRSSQGELFIGNLNSIENGASTSTDPIRAIIFAIESASKRGAGKGVLQIYLPKDLKGLNLQASNEYRFSLELEVIVNTSPENLSNFVVKEIPIEEARNLVKKVYGVDLDTKMSRETANYWLKNTNKLLPKEAMKFYKEAIKIKTKE